MFDKELRSKAEILLYLENLLREVPKLGFKQTAVYLKKISLLEELYARVKSREFPEFSEANSSWVYKIEPSNFGVYLNMKASRDTGSSGPNDVPSYHLVKLTSRYLNISEYARQNNCNENAIRQRIKRGAYLYARFDGTWLLPEWSTPQDDAQLSNGRFYVFQTPEEMFHASDNNSIELHKDDRILIVEQPRTSNNEKFFKIFVEKFDHVTRKVENKREYLLNPTDKQRFVFFLVRTPNIDFWGDAIGIVQWLAN